MSIFNNNFLPQLVQAAAACPCSLKPAAAACSLPLQYTWPSWSAAPPSPCPGAGGQGEAVSLSCYSTTAPTSASCCPPRPGAGAGAVPLVLWRKTASYIGVVIKVVARWRVTAVSTAIVYIEKYSCYSCVNKANHVSIYNWNINY